MKSAYEEMIEWAISALDSLGHDLETGVESKRSAAARAHFRAQDLRKRLTEERAKHGS